MGMREWMGLLTLVGTLTAGWFLYDLLRAEPGSDRLRVVLLFEDAEGIYAGTPIKTRGVTVGEVRRVNLAPGGRGTEVLCSLSRAPGASPRVGSRFWIVRPWFGGLAAGGGGLDTLIKDSYVAFEMGDLSSPPLADDSRVPGMRNPPDNPRALLDLPPEPGDIEFSVRFATSGGLKAAAPVRHRGIRVGLVTAVELLPAGDGVEIRARIGRDFRPLVFSSSVFWIDGVDIEAGWSGVSVEGLEAILEGAALSFYTPEKGTKVPASDRTVFVGSPTHPEIEWALPTGEELSSAAGSSAGEEDPLLDDLVQVHYSCLEKDFFSANDRYERTTPGILHRTLDGLPAVLVLARAVDGRLWVEDGGGDPEIADESIAIRHRDGSVQTGGVAWRAGETLDLALLRIPQFPGGHPPIPIQIPSPEALAGPVDLYIPHGNGEWKRTRGSLAAEGTLSGVPAETPDAILTRNGRPIGLWRAGADSTPGQVTLFDALPGPLRNRDSRSSP